MNLIAPGTTINLVTGPGIIIVILFIAIIYNELSYTSVENTYKYIYIITIFYIYIREYFYLYV